MNIFIYNDDINRMDTINSLSEKEQIDIVKEFGLPAYLKITNPSENVQCAFARSSWFAISHIDNPSEKVQMAAVKMHPKCIQFLRNPAESVIRYVINREGANFTVYMSRTVSISEETQLKFVEPPHSPYNISLIENPTPRVQMLVYESDVSISRFIPTKCSPMTEDEIERRFQLDKINFKTDIYNRIRNPCDELKKAHFELLMFNPTN